VTGEPKWLADTIDALADRLQDISSPDYPRPDDSYEWDDEDVARWKAGEVVRAALPVIREGLAQEIEAQQPNAYNDGWYNGLALAAEIVRTEP
jgi:hypothetical protein